MYVQKRNTKHTRASCHRGSLAVAIFDDLGIDAQWRQHTRAVLAEQFGIRVLSEYLSDGLPGEGRSWGLCDALFSNYFEDLLLTDCIIVAICPLTCVFSESVLHCVCVCVCACV